MSDAATPSAGGPPPLPVPPPLPPRQAWPVLPAGDHLPALPPGFAPPPQAAPATGPGPVAYSAAHPPPPPPGASVPAYVPAPPPAESTNGPVFHAPRDLELDAQQSGGPGWILWAVPGVVLFMVAAGLVAFVATRGGPSRATASVSRPAPGRPAPSFQPVPKPGGTVKVAPRRLNGGGSDPASATNPGKGTPLPPAREVDRLLKEMWQAGEANGMKFKTIRTLKMERTSGSLVQPVEVKVAATFPQSVQLLRFMRNNFPAAVTASFDAASETGEPSAASGPLPVSFTLNWHLSESNDELANTVTGEIRQPDVARSLIDVARLGDGKVAIVGVSFQVAGAAGPPGTKLRPEVKVVGLAESDIVVAEYFQKLKVSGHVKEINLAVCESAQVGGTPVRKFTIEFQVPPPDPAANLNPVEPARGMPDPFQAPAWLRAPRKPTGAAAARPGAHTPAPSTDAQRAEAARLVGQLNLQSIVARNPKSATCMINGQLYRTGQQVGGFTVVGITAETVTVRRGELTFELKVKK